MEAHRHMKFGIRPLPSMKNNICVLCLDKVNWDESRIVDLNAQRATHEVDLEGEAFSVCDQCKACIDENMDYFA